MRAAALGVREPQDHHPPGSRHYNYRPRDLCERLQKRAIDVHFLMLAVALGSASIGAWGEGTTLLFLFSLSGALEGFALGRTQREIRSLFRDAPKFATVVGEGRHEREVQVEKLRPGMRLLVKPGAQFAVDAEVVKGQTAVDESNLTGEVTTRIACWGFRSSCFSSGGWDLDRRRLPLGVSGIARFTTP